jgi:hypothetical protein
MAHILIKKTLNHLGFVKSSPEKIKREQFIINIFTSLLALSFLLFFMFIDMIHIEYVLKIYSLFTEKWFKIAMFMLAIFFFLISVLDRNFSFMLLICTFLLGHFLFVNVFDDTYSIDGSATIEPETKARTAHFYHSNMG